MAAGEKGNKLHRIYEMEGRNTSSTDPKMMESRLFIGNLASDLVGRQEIEKLFSKYGKILGVSLHKSFGFVQFETKEEAENAVKGEKGTSLKGLNMDLCIATERRRDPIPSGRNSRRPPPPPRLRSRSPRRRRDREWERDRDRWDWPDRRPPSPPPLRYRGGPIDPYRDPFYLRDDPYFHPPRDDPFDRYPPPIDPYDRYPPPLRPHPRDYPPLRRDRYDSDPWVGGSDDPYSRERDRFPPHPSSAREDLFGALLPKVAERKSTEMEIIVVSQQQKEYAQMVRQQVESVGVLVEMRQLSPTFSLLEALDSAAKRGFLYTIIITSQHESHRSVTLTILHGRNPQEHKNMPLGDAIGLIERDYDQYGRTGRTSARSPPRPAIGGGTGGRDSVSSLMAKAAAGGNLSSGELNTLISTLQQKHSSIRQTETRAPTTPASAEDIQQQQADLQAKILSLLGSNAVVPASKTAPSPHNTARRYESGLDSIGASYGGSGGTNYGSSYQRNDQSKQHPYGSFQ